MTPMNCPTAMKTSIWRCDYATGQTRCHYSVYAGGRSLTDSPNLLVPAYGGSSFGSSIPHLWILHIPKFPCIVKGSRRAYFAIAFIIGAPTISSPKPMTPCSPSTIACWMRQSQVTGLGPVRMFGGDCSTRRGEHRACGFSHLYLQTARTPVRG